MLRTYTVLLLLLFVFLTTASFAADTEQGKELHNTHCKSCHVGMSGGEGDLLYTRADRRANSLTKLENQVRRCETNLELKWFEEDIMDVVQFLNTHYYKFKPRQ